MPSLPPWLVFADDWGRHPSSCQHLLRHQLAHRQVLWVNTIGTRPPRLDWSTFKRAAGKLKGWMRKGEPGPQGPRVPAAEGSQSLAPRILSPKMWPSFRSRFGRGLNRKLLLRALRPVVAALPTPPVVVTTLPLVADLMGALPVVRWVYYCVDDFSVWPGYDGETMLRMERDLLPKLDTAVAVSETLQTKLAAMGRPAHLLTHGVDLDHWQSHATDLPPEFVGLEPPFVLFWGVIDRRMDVAFVRRVCETLSAGTVVMVGPQEDPDPALKSIPRLVLRPPVAFSRLPGLAKAATVLVMPYADLPATRAMQPLKLKEYLATGKPAVVRELPSTTEWADAADVCGSADEFAAAVRQRLVSGLPAEQGQARERLTAEGWAAKSEVFGRCVDGEKVA